MITFEAESTDAMAQTVYDYMSLWGEECTSRNGPVLRLDEPVSMVYTRPWLRCNFTKGRDANPVFHHMESLWMLAGRRDVAFLNLFNSQIKQYSDDGKVFNAAYGYRIRKHFGFDQLTAAIEILKHEPDSRQVVVQIWDPTDLLKHTKDKACNLNIVFSIDIDDKVNALISNRSNDAVYGGVTGANPVHFSYFLQYVSERLNKEMGKLQFVSNNLHVYTELYDHWDKMDWSIVEPGYPTSQYPIGDIREVESFCDCVVDRGVVLDSFESPLIEFLSKPMLNFWMMRKYREDFDGAAFHLDEIKAPDWHAAITNWVNKRGGL